MSGSASVAPAQGDAPFDNFAFLGLAKDVLVGDIRYSYHRFGTADGGKPALVLIQGLGGVQYGWPVKALEELAKSREIVVFDNALAGLSVDTKAGERPLDLTVPFMAQSTVDFIKTLQLPTAPDVLGISMGGMVAQWMAVHHGSAVGSVVIAASSYGKGAPEPEGGIQKMLDYLGSEQSSTDPSLLLPVGLKEVDKDPGFAALMRHISSLQYAAIPEFMGIPGAAYATGSGIMPPSPDLFTVSADARTKQAAAIRQFWEGASLLPGLAASKKRLLWITGTKDAIFPAETSEKAATAVPGSWLMQIEGAGHGLSLQQPKEFAQKVLKFLDASKAEDKQHRQTLTAAAQPGCFAGMWGHRKH